MRLYNWRTKCLGAPSMSLLVLFVIIGQFSDIRISGSSDTEKRATIIQRAFKQLLKVKSLPSVRVKSGNGGRQLPVSIPPQYMLELYEKYRQAAGSSETGSRGNTVRSIVAIKGNINGNQMLVFNISGIHSQEEMLRSELHFYKRRKVKWHRLQAPNANEYRMTVYDIASDRVNSLATIDVPSRSHGWQVHDLTRTVIQCRRENGGHGGHHLLGVKFEGLNKRKTRFVGIPLNKFVNLNSQPFLIVFSNDRANSTVDDLETTHNDDLDMDGEQKWYETGTLLDDEDYGDGHLDYDLESADNQATNQKQPSATDNKTSSFLKRFSRSAVLDDENSIREGDYGPLLDNELPDTSVQSNHIPPTNPGILQSRRRSKAEVEAIKTIPYPPVMTFGKHQHRKNKTPAANSFANKKQRNRKLPKAWQHPLGDDRRRHQARHENEATAPEVHGARGTAGSGTVCRKRKLVVDFADIGWGEWIISPKSFEAQYCAGMCPFPLSKNLKPSNHATIQSIVHAIGLQPNVPAPCCVADTMSSVTLLYFDEDRNVVLKNYPSMTVESCACR